MDQMEQKKSSVAMHLTSLAKYQSPPSTEIYRNELFARMEQLGPFHFFFTLSAAEMLWPEVTTAILHYEQQIDKIIYKPGWEEDEGQIEIYFIDWEDGDEKKVRSLKNT